MYITLKHTDSGLRGLTRHAEVCLVESTDYFTIIILSPTGTTVLPKVTATNALYSSTFLFWQNQKVFLLHEGRAFDCTLRLENHTPVIESIDEKIQLDIRREHFDFYLQSLESESV